MLQHHPTMARVSIAVPTLNARPFLEERFGGILRQTYTDWDVFVYDSHSDDGSWEYIQEIAGRDARVRAVQGPREGPYVAWNECVRQSDSEFVYIATADDTLAPNCLAELVAALDRHPACDLAHCPLRFTHADGSPVPGRVWPNGTVFAEGLDGLVGHEHVRHAPHDGLLHLTGRHVYFSITQLLIRRSLFAKIGFFADRWGAVSDFNWEMRAGLAADTVHVPSTWASWTLHPKQLTSTHGRYSREKATKVEEMIDDALASCAPPSVLKMRSDPWFRAINDLREYHAVLLRTPRLISKRLHQMRRVITGPSAVRQAILRRCLTGEAWPLTAVQEIRRQLHGRYEAGAVRASVEKVEG
ncbi:MAG: glycosyl transferase family 2 [Verrucomicrobia bacterium]|nr:glycosyl transferase family 2 [Verrucomicrobiota bacterium]